MPLDLFDDVLLLDLPLEAAKGVLQSFALLKLYFSQTKYTSQLDQDSRTAQSIFPRFAQRVLIS